MAVVGWVLVAGAFLVLVVAVNGSWQTLWAKLVGAEGGTVGSGSSSSGNQTTSSGGTVTPSGVVTGPLPTSSSGNPEGGGAGQPVGSATNPGMPVGPGVSVPGRG